LQKIGPNRYQLAPNGNNCSNWCQLHGFGCNRHQLAPSGAIWQQLAPIAPISAKLTFFWHQLVPAVATWYQLQPAGSSSHVFACGARQALDKRFTTAVRCAVDCGAILKMQQPENVEPFEKLEDVYFGQASIFFQSVFFFFPFCFVH
jgi:hypothetical protein